MTSTTTAPPPRPRVEVRPPARGRRRPRPAPRRRLRLVVAVAVLALLLGGGWLIGFSSVFDTRQVTISGAHVLSADQVRDSARVPLGRPLARQDVDAVTARLQALAPVESVRVERRWPHTVAVALTERTPMLAVPIAGGFSLVDRTGVAFQTVPAVPDGVVEARIDPQDAALVTEAGAVAAGLGELAGDVVRIEGTSPSSIVVVLTGKVTVTWGSADQSELKAQIVRQLLKQDPKAIDVSAPHSPAIR